MILETPITFAANVVMAPKRNFEWLTFRESLTIEVPEVGAEEAPVACWMVYPGTRDGVEIAVRVRDGKYYAPVVSRDLSARSWDRTGKSEPGVAAAPDAVRAKAKSLKKLAVAMTADGLMKSITAGEIAIDPSLSPDRMSGAHRDREPQKFDGNPKVRKVERNRRAEVEKAIRAVVDRFLVVDGVAYRQVSAPMLVCSRPRTGGSLINTMWAHQVGDPGLAFPIDQFDDAVQFAASNLQFFERGNNQSVDTPMKKRLQYVKQDSGAMRPEIVDASLLTIDRRGWMLEKAKRIVLANFARKGDGTYGSKWGASKLSEHPRDVLEAFLDVRDAGKDDDLLEPMRKLAEAIRPIGILNDLHLMVKAVIEACDLEPAPEAGNDVMRIAP